MRCAKLCRNVRQDCERIRLEMFILSQSVGFKSNRQSAARYSEHAMTFILFASANANEFPSQWISVWIVANMFALRSFGYLLKVSLILCVSAGVSVFVCARFRFPNLPVAYSVLFSGFVFCTATDRRMSVWQVDWDVAVMQRCKPYHWLKLI